MKQKKANLLFTFFGLVTVSGFFLPTAIAACTLKSSAELTGWQKGLLDQHNLDRMKVSPPASDMMCMLWDDTIAANAQAWANGCVFQHSSGTYRQNIGNWSYLGENLAAGVSVDASNPQYAGMRVSRMWNSEVADYTLDNNSCTPGKACGHYTQEVWANTYALGCGYAACINLWVCQYGPGGNVAGTKPYTKSSTSDTTWLPPPASSGCTCWGNAQTGPTCASFDYGNCKTNRVLKASLDTIVCTGPTCTDADCCTDAPVCTGFSVSNCRAQQHVKANPDTVHCRTLTCDFQDCCEFDSCSNLVMTVTNGPYTSLNGNYTLDAALVNGRQAWTRGSNHLRWTNGWLLTGNNDPTSGAGFAFGSGDVDAPNKVYSWGTGSTMVVYCGNPAASCGEFESLFCTSIGKLLRANPSSVSCATPGTCLASDCCIEAPKCTGFTNCGLGKHLKSNLDSVQCRAATCDAVDCCDFDICDNKTMIVSGYSTSVNGNYSLNSSYVNGRPSWLMGAHHLWWIGWCWVLTDNTDATVASGFAFGCEDVPLPHMVVSWGGTTKVACGSFLPSVSQGQGGAMVNCSGQWNLGTSCSTSCGNGVMTDRYQVLTAAANGGAACEAANAATRSRTCNLGSCLLLNNCSMPALIPKGYVYDNTSCVGPIVASQCSGITCAPGYDGTPTVSCATNKGTFTLAGCVENVCSLPSNLGSGYTPPGAGKCVGLMKAGACVLTCASGYTGTPKLFCAANTTTFDVWGCQPNNCSLPLATAMSKAFTYDNVSCAGPTTVAQCGGVTCAPGNDGAVALACPTNKGTFTLNGCSENVCSLPTLGPEYTPPAAGKCVGLMKAAGCLLTCNKGYTGTPKLFCAANATEFTVSGCRLNLCTLPLASAMVGYQFDATCPGNQTVMDCAASVSCAPGYHGLANLTCSTDKGKFVLGGCSDNLCSLPNPLPPGYLLPSTGKCLGPVKASSCTGLKCARGFSGTPIDFCPVDGGIFDVSGCYPNNCTRGNVAGYSYSGSSCDGLMNAANCAGHACGPGFHGHPMITCPDNNKNISLTGCTPNQCKLPNPLPGPYTIASGKCVGYTTAADLSVKTTRKTDCLDVKCNLGFYGTPVLSCPADGQFFQLDGCVENFCKMPATMPVGFATSSNFATDCPTTDLGTTDGPFYTASDLANCAGVVCAQGYNGPPVVPVCATRNTTLAFYGCSPNQCELPDPMPANYQSSGECYGLQPVSTCKGVTCAVGVTPTLPSVILTCPADLGVFVLDGCD